MSSGTSISTGSSCSARTTGNLATDSANLLVCQLDTLALSFPKHLSCIPRGGGTACNDLLAENEVSVALAHKIISVSLSKPPQPCANVVGNNAAAKCICTRDYYAGLQKCIACTGDSQVVERESS